MFVNYQSNYPKRMYSPFSNTNSHKLSNYFYKFFCILDICMRHVLINKECYELE